MNYHLPYSNLSKEGKKDVDFFKNQLKVFQKKLAVMAFCDIKTCETIGETINLLKTLIKACELHQRHLERMEQIEYKAYLHELGINIANSQGTEVRAGLADKKPSILKREITWTTQG